METLPTEPAHRLTSIIVLLQVGVVLGGTLFVNTMLKAYGYDSSMGFGAPFSDESVFIRPYGLTLLLVPMLWTAWAIYAGKVLTSPNFRRVVLGIGFAAVFLGIVLYLKVGMGCYQYIMLMSRLRGLDDSWWDCSGSASPHLVLKCVALRGWVW